MDETASAEVEPARARPPVRAAAHKLVKWGIAGAVLLAAIAAQVSGPIVAIHVRDQQRVEKGELLVEIDPRPYQIAVDSAQAQLELAYQTIR